MYSILHVDNSIFFKKILEKVARDNQFQLVSVTTPDQALDALGQKSYDLIITGLELRGMNGIDFIKHLNKSAYKEVSKVILTSNDTVEIRKEADELGVMDVLQKDISLNSLYIFIERIKNMHAVKRALETMSVAVLEPNINAARNIRSIFKREGILNVQYFKSLDRFMNTEKKFSLFIININTLNYSCEKLIIDIRRENMSAIIIVVSDEYETESVSNVLLAGADDFSIQPLDRKIFMARVNANVRLQMHLEEIEDKNHELERINTELNRLVITDGLTGLFNHKYTIERLELEIEKASRYDRKLAVMMMDIDHFKKVNDTFGHQSGDEVLVKVAEAIQHNLRKVDIVGRYGGEEFLIILPETDLIKGQQTADKIRRVIKELEFEADGLSITISGGLCAWESENVTSLIRKADELLYNAKHYGRDQIVIQQSTKMESIEIQ